MALEIERRWLVEKPIWIEQPELGPAKMHIDSIVQFYLKGDNPIRRIREVTRLTGEPTLLQRIYTEKTHISEGIAEEVERSIDQKEYLALVRQTDHTRYTIVKWRYTFQHRGNTFELDCFAEPTKLYILEVELPRLDFRISLPPSITVIREITGSKELSNHGIASRKVS